MKPLRQIAFVLEDFALQTPAQQLLDRFLLGYRRDGGFHKVESIKVVAHLPGGANEALARRVAELGLTRAADVAAAARDADAIIVVPRADFPTPAEGNVTTVLAHAKRGASCFV
ncbi:MAG: hypothetical protein RLZZ265_1470, partial [Verrucomicrobiota bacterium]